MKIAVIGLGYVGLPLACSLSQHFDVIGYDKSVERVGELRAGLDRSREVTEQELRRLPVENVTADLSSLTDRDMFIVAVPTPIDDANEPDLRLLELACDELGTVLKRGNVVVFESTVYPGATEEICVPRLQRSSGLELNVDFGVGYSPERINPGDKVHRFESIVKVVAGSDEKTAALVASVYGKCVHAGIHIAPTIKVAEMAKVIENTQRDINIALINEVAKISRLMGIDVAQVLQAAKTKWNFCDFKPGLVGGHCIGIDPYYLVWKSRSIGYEPKIMSAGRLINDEMHEFYFDVIRSELGKRYSVADQPYRVLFLGFTFKADCPDIRNTRVQKLAAKFQSDGKYILDIVDPVASIDEVQSEYGIAIYNTVPRNLKYDVTVCLVPHRNFIEPDSVAEFARVSNFIIDFTMAFPQVDNLIRP